MKCRFLRLQGILFSILFITILAASCSAQTGIFAVGKKHLYLHCEGARKGPAVVLDAGLFRDSTDWRKVQPKIAQFTQVCSYDREGLGKSVIDKNVEPETECIEEKVEDLRGLLKAAHINPPYVLVGHSAAGVRVRRYTRDYTSEVVGLVLVDSAHEEQIWRFQAIDPASVQGPPADPVKARCGGALPDPGERLVWHYDIPLIVLEHGIPLTFEGPLAAHTAEFNQAVDAMAKDLASRSDKGQLRIAGKSGHDIMLDEPSLVVQAVRDVWHEAMASRH
jgi:pimeloyl-ACP methyl ester carboxylesterase